MLTALVHQKLPELRFVEWFRIPNSSGCTPRGPLVTMTRSQFERVGLDFVLFHFKNYEQVVMGPKESSAIFETLDDKKLLKKHVPLAIYRHYKTGTLEIIPQKFRQYDLGGLASLDRDLFPTASLSLDCSPEEFVRAFDSVAAEAG